MILLGKRRGFERVAHRYLYHAPRPQAGCVAREGAYFPRYSLMEPTAIMPVVRA